MRCPISGFTSAPCALRPEPPGRIVHWTGPGTPPDVVAKLHGTITKILATPEMQDRLSKAGAETRPGTSAEFGAFIASEKARWAKVVKESGAKFD